MTLELYKRLQGQVLREFGDIVEDAEVVSSESGRPKKLRIYLIERTFLDIWFSSRTGNYSYHWERKEIDGSVYRHDNAPHSRWSYVSTFPAHSMMVRKEMWLKAICQKLLKKRSGPFLFSVVRSCLVEKRRFQNR